MVDAVSREAELDEVTDALVLTPSDDFNALAAEELRVELGHEHVLRLAPHPDAPCLVPPANEDGLLLSYDEMSRQFQDAAKIAAEVGPAGRLTLYFARADGTHVPARQDGLGASRRPGYSGAVSGS
jgi:hypothetical protein